LIGKLLEMWAKFALKELQTRENGFYSMEDLMGELFVKSIFAVHPHPDDYSKTEETLFYI